MQNQREKEKNGIFCSSPCPVIFPFPRAKAALNLETQIENTDKIVSTFEAKLAQDSIIPASPNALQDRANDLQVGEHQALC